MLPREPRADCLAAQHRERATMKLEHARIIILNLSHLLLEASSSDGCFARLQVDVRPLKLDLLIRPQTGEERELIIVGVFGSPALPKLIENELDLLERERIRLAL